MSYRLIGTLRAAVEAGGTKPSPAFQVILMLLSEGYSMPEVCHVLDISVSIVGKWTHSLPHKRMLPGPRVEVHCELIRIRLAEQFTERSDTFPLPPDELKTLLLL